MSFRISDLEPRSVEIQLSELAGQLRLGKQKPETPGSSRTYFLKGLARCIYCGFPTWSQTTGGGYAFYREAKNSHANGVCPANGKTVVCRKVDQQMDDLVESLTLDHQWRKAILTKVSRGLGKTKFHL